MSSCRNLGCGEEIQNQDSVDGIFNPTTCNNSNNNYSTLLPPFNAAVNNHHHHQQFNLLGENPVIGSPKELIIKSPDMDADEINNMNSWQKVPHQDSTTTSSLISNDFLHDHNMMMMMRNHFGHDENEQAHVARGNNNNNNNIIIDQYSRTHRLISPNYAGGGLFPAVTPTVVNSRSFGSIDQMLSKPFLKTHLDLSSSARCRKQGFRNSPVRNLSLSLPFSL